MIITKYAKQKMDVLKRTHFDLYSTVMLAFPLLSNEERGKIAGLIIEAVLKSGGDSSILDDELDSPLEIDQDYVLE